MAAPAGPQPETFHFCRDVIFPGGDGSGEQPAPEEPAADAPNGDAGSDLAHRVKEGSVACAATAATASLDLQ